LRPETGSDTVDAILFAAHRVRTAADAALREHGLSLSGLKLLRALAAGDRSMREVSQALHVSPRTVTDLIDGLQARGLVSRGPHPTDRRVTLLHLTGTGAAELAAASAVSERVAAVAVGGLGPAERQALCALLHRVGTTAWHCGPITSPEATRPAGGPDPGAARARQHRADPRRRLGAEHRDEQATGPAGGAHDGSRPPVRDGP